MKKYILLGLMYSHVSFGMHEMVSGLGDVAKVFSVFGEILSRVQERESQIEKDTAMIVSHQNQQWLDQALKPFQDEAERELEEFRRRVNNRMIPLRNMLALKYFWSSPRYDLPPKVEKIYRSNPCRDIIVYTGGSFLSGFKRYRIVKS